MLRTLNYVVEVFVDLTRDGGGHAQAFLLCHADRHLLGRGVADLPPPAGDGDGVDELSLLVAALRDLVDAVTTMTDRHPPMRVRSAVA